MVSDELAHSWASRFASPTMGCRGQATHDFVLLGDEAVGIALAILDGRGVEGIGAPGLARRAAIISLGRLGAPAVSAVPTLVEWLTRDTTLASDAATALGEIGLAARSAVPVLIEVPPYRREWPDRDTAAIVALGRIGGAEAETAIASLADAPGTPPLVRTLCLKALKQMRGETDSA